MIELNNLVNNISEFLKLLRRYTELQNKETLELKCLNKEGEEFPVEFVISDWNIDGNGFYVAKMSDITKRQALQNRLKFNPDLDLDQKVKYGFLGEVVLFSVLYILFKAQPLIARGYFYNPLENSETKGYDSYHLIENNNQTELWFGEVKFHKNYKTGLKSIFKNIDKAISDDYLKTNVFAISNQINNLHYKGSKIETVIKDWEENPYLSIIDEMKQHNMKLVYPVMLLYEEDDLGFDKSIKNIPKYIKDEFTANPFGITVDYSIFFILLPMKDVKTIKEEVIKWIELKKPLMS